MKKLFGFSVLLGAAAAGCENFDVSVGQHHGGIGGVQGSGKVASETRNVGDFQRLEAGGGLEINLTVGPSTSFKISGDDNILPLIESKVDSHGVLHIQSKKGYNAKKRIVVTLTTPAVDGLDISGASDLRATGVSADKLSLQCSGASKMKLDGSGKEVKIDFNGASEGHLQGLNASSLSGVLSGASHVDATGSANSLVLDLSGASSVDLFGLKAESAKLEFSGASDGKVFATGSIEGELSGASSLTYKGTSNVHLDKNGASSAHGVE